jgi:hypothetical protein
MTRADLKARIILLEAELQRERTLKRTPPLPDEVLRLRRELAEMQGLLRIHGGERLRIYKEIRSLHTASGATIARLRRHLQLKFHPDRKHKFRSVEEVLTAVSRTINNIMEEGCSSSSSGFSGK